MQPIVDFESNAVPSVKPELRRWHRRRVLKSGLIDFNNGYSRFSCIVKNLTENGAMLEMGETTGIPSRVGFQVDDLRSKEAESFGDLPTVLESSSGKPDNSDNPRFGVATL